MEDKRIIKTKKAIYQALKELYLENDFEDISITQLTEKANIGRKTFYLHYSSIDDIVDEIVKKLYDNLKKKYNELYNKLSTILLYDKIVSFRYLHNFFKRSESNSFSNICSYIISSNLSLFFLNLSKQFINSSLTLNILGIYILHLLHASITFSSDKSVLRLLLMLLLLIDFSIL